MNIRTAFVLLALAGAGAAVHAQSNNPTGPGNTNANKAGEAYPNDPNAVTPKPKAEIVKKVEESRPVQATERGLKKAGDAVKKAGTKTKNAIKRTGEKLNEKVPPGPNDAKS